MTVRELIINLLEFDLDLDVYVGKGMGPLENIRGGAGIVVVAPKGSPDGRA